MFFCFILLSHISLSVPVIVLSMNVFGSRFINMQTNIIYTTVQQQWQENKPIYIAIL